MTFINLTVLYLLVLNKVHKINCSDLEQAGIGAVGVAGAAGAASKCMAASLVFSKMAQMLSKYFLLDLLDVKVCTIKILNLVCFVL